MTEIALAWEDVPEDLPVVMTVGNEERELRKKLLRAGTEESLKLGYREFQEGNAHPTQLHTSIATGPFGDYVIFDAGKFWATEIRSGVYDQHVRTIAEVCRRASAIVFDRIDNESDTRSIASMAAAFGVPRTAVWVDALPREPDAAERKATAVALAKEALTKVQVFEGDMREIVECGPKRCEVCAGYQDLLEFVVQPRKIASESFRMLVEEATGWGVKPYARIARGAIHGQVEVGDDVEVFGKGERYTTKVDDIARGGIVFTLKELSAAKIDALAKPETLELRDVVAARSYGESTEEIGQAFIDGSHLGRVKVGAVGKKNVLRFERRVPFRRGDVVTVFIERGASEPLRSESYLILDD